MKISRVALILAFLFLILSPIPASAEPVYQDLIIGTPVAGNLSGTGAEQYYQVSVTAGQHLIIVLDSESNFNTYDLYIKFASLPSTVDYEDKGDSPQADQAVEIASTQAGYYYIMLRSTSGGGNYTLVAHTTSSFPALTLGATKSGDLQGTYDIKYYQVSVTAGQHLFVVLDSESNFNTYDLYIKFASLPTTVDYEDKGDSPQADQAVEIASTQAGYYYIMIRSTSSGGNYTLVAHTTSSFPALTLGATKSGSLQGTYDIKYYQVSVTAGQHLTIVLDSESNFNTYDLYIKFASLPTTVDFEDKGDSPQADQAVEIASTQAGYYYIMIRSTSSGGNYTLVAHTTSSFPALTLGATKSGSLQGTYDIKYYQVSVTAGQHLIVVLDSESNFNTYDLYIKFASLPTIVDYEDKGDSPQADQAVEIASTQAGYYYIMIRSTSSGGSYTLVAHTTSSFPALTLGATKSGSLQGTYDIKYYQVSVTAGQHLIVVLDSESNFNTYDLYIKFASLPTIVDYEDKGDSPQADQAVEIASTQAGYYYIMIRSTSSGGNYTLVAHTTSSFPALTLGGMRSGSLQGTYDIKYYQVSVTAGQHLFVVLDSESNFNAYDLYIKFASLPTIVDYEDKGDSPQADQAVEIASTQAGYYYIMIRSTSSGGNYTLVAHTTSSFPALTLGGMRSGSLQGTYDIKYYQVSVTAGQHLFVVLDSESNFNTYDLYIKFASLPTTVDYEDKGDSPQADQTVEIVSTQAGYYYIMIRSTSGGGNYNIAAFTHMIFLPNVKKN